MANNLQGRSWNDPPVLKFEGTGLTGKHHLNKRVFSPLNKQDLQDTSPKGESYSGCRQHATITNKQEERETCSLC
ncbi:hypothetical protein TNCV_1209911 [Trichonephila clavipes]|nr:hypothetical protein TNCV_1209911 [Trichonephila clavipes]